MEVLPAFLVITAALLAGCATGGRGELRLRVSPTDGNDRVGAFASCIRVK